MSRSFASVKIMTSMISNKVSGAISKRGLAAVSKGSEGSSINILSQKLPGSEPAWWLPDPVTGIYRPENKVSGAISKRGLAAVSKGSEESSINVLSQKLPGSEPAWWLPDPVTGIYRPENASNEIDVAELRRVLRERSKIRKKN